MSVELEAARAEGDLAVVVVGGGLAGLAAATFLARTGRRVTLLEKARAPGGRAVTQPAGPGGSWRFNLGPHALYRGGPAERILKELGVTPRGRMPATAGGFAVEAGVAHTLPAGPLSLLATGLLPLAAKLEAARLFAGLGRVDPAPWASRTVRAWVDQTVRQPAMRRLLHALTRVATYADEPDRQSAATAIGQLQRVARHGVLYLDGGWQSLVDGLAGAARAAGVRAVTGVRAASVVLEEIGGGRAAVRGVRLEDGTTLAAAAAVLAVDPETACGLTRGGADPSLRAWASGAVPVRAATLDVALSRLPRARALFALGIDRPLYVSVHSAAARLAPDGGAVIHVARYLGAGDAGDEAELEALLDGLQPGWREAVV
ncbi:MAG TPA: FAD-dependent oxidoreductase, partial [Myxococcota bacterium]|nr:FAD-dependent oxidoreductase [Myxococcota bacterium]